MPCNCKQSWCPECMGGWTPSPEPELGSEKWKDRQAFNYVIEKFNGLPKRDAIIKLPADWGYMAIQYRIGSGHDYFRVAGIDA